MSLNYIISDINIQQNIENIKEYLKIHLLPKAIEWYNICVYKDKDYFKPELGQHFFEIDLFKDRIVISADEPYITEPEHRFDFISNLFINPNENIEEWVEKRITEFNTEIRVKQEAKRRLSEKQKKQNEEREYKLYLELKEKFKDRILIDNPIINPDSHCKAREILNLNISIPGLNDICDGCDFFEDGHCYLFLESLCPETIYDCNDLPDEVHSKCQKCIDKIKGN